MHGRMSDKAHSSELTKEMKMMVFSSCLFIDLESISILLTYATSLMDTTISE